MPLMFHPNLPDKNPTPTSIQAFNIIWEKKGWVLVSESVGPVGSPVHYYGNLTLPELRKHASDLDIPGRSSMDRDELVAALIEASPKEPVSPNSPSDNYPQTESDDDA